MSFATKPKLGRAMLERAVAAGVPCAWVAADSVYGGDYALRLWLERQPIGYVLAVTSKQRVPPASTASRSGPLRALGPMTGGG
ncbi:SRSO17 transposase [Skermanella aerolata]|jgi:SRSO17 transposase